MAARVLIGGYYGFGNIGDEALLSVLLEKLRECLPELEPVVLSHDPEWTAAEYKVEAINRWNPFKIWGELGRAGLFLLGGGGLLQDVTSFRSTLYYLGLIRLAAIRKVPVALIGQGIGPLRSPLLRRLVVGHLRRVDYIMVRDERSRELLEAWGADRGQLVRGYDLALGLALEPSSEEQERRDLLAISLKEPGRDKRVRTEFITEMAAVIDEVHRRFGLRPAFAPLHPREDLRLTEEVRKEMAEESLVLDLEGLPLQEVLKLLSQARLMLGMRLHALEFALICAVPFLAFSADPKVEEFVKLVEGALGLEVSLLKAPGVKGERLLAALGHLLEEEAEYRARLIPAALRLREEATSSLEEACRRLAELLVLERPKVKARRRRKGRAKASQSRPRSRSRSNSNSSPSPREHDMT
ncbi:TPA: polysaccharide pyruvyl transferase CsaB [Candidatus Bipolaricaulota bacterium]|nr:polysaccharide pyruvyl transferase CsaB [Candidatus Bipolaricaulota bacterium]